MIGFGERRRLADLVGGWRIHDRRAELVTRIDEQIATQRSSRSPRDDLEIAPKLRPECELDRNQAGQTGF